MIIILILSTYFRNQTDDITYFYISCSVTAAFVDIVDCQFVAINAESVRTVSKTIRSISAYDIASVFRGTKAWYSANVYDDV